MNLGDKIAQSERAVERVIIIDRVLDIIDSHMPLSGNSITNKRVRGSLKSIRKDILALKGGEHEISN